MFHLSGNRYPPLNLVLVLDLENAKNRQICLPVFLSGLDNKAEDSNSFTEKYQVTVGDLK